LTQNLEVVFATGSPFAPLFGQENMTIYCWNNP